MVRLTQKLSMPTKKLTVKYNGAVVGQLAQLEKGKIAFQYDASWLASGFSISPLSLPLAGEVFISSKSTFGGLYGVFADSLPDGWGELLVLRMLAKKGINYRNLSPLEKLALISGNGLGALTYEPSFASFEGAKDHDLDQLAREAMQILQDQDYTEGVDFDALYALGGSSGGARPKAHITRAGEHWIVKFPTKQDPIDIGLNEFFANRLAKECGINVNDFKLFESQKTPGYFGAKRFDIDGAKRVHTVSLSSLLETTHRLPNLDYGHLFAVIRRISQEPSDNQEAFRRMCFNVFFGNKDDHGKNFAFVYDEKTGGYKLSPAYDTTKTTDKFEHEMTANGSGNPKECDLMALAVDMNLNQKECQQILYQTKSNLKAANALIEQ